MSHNRYRVIAATESRYEKGKEPKLVGETRQLRGVTFEDGISETVRLRKARPFGAMGWMVKPEEEANEIYEEMMGEDRPDEEDLAGLAPPEDYEPDRSYQEQLSYLKEKGWSAHEVYGGQPTGEELEVLYAAHEEGMGFLVEAEPEEDEESTEEPNGEESGAEEPAESEAPDEQPALIG